MSSGRAAQRSEARELKVFLWAAAATVLMVVGFVAWMLFVIGGDRVTIAVDDIGEAVAALAAAVCCGLAARRQSGRQRLGWSLLSASAATWAAGELVWCVYEVVLRVDVPFPSAADAGFLGAVPLAAGGILAFFSTPRGTSTRLRLWLDGLIIFLALIFIAWTLGLKIVYAEYSAAKFMKLIDLAYPIGDILIITLLVLAIRRARDAAKGTLLLLLGGLAAYSLADSAYAYLNATGAYGAVGSVLDAGWVAGYLMIGLAALWPASIGRKVVVEHPIDIWQIILPWIAVLGAGLTGIVLALTGHSLDPFQTLLAGAMTALVMISQVYANRESLALLIESRLSASTLNDIVVNAPLGVVRIGLDMRIIQANPRFAELLRRPEREVFGALLSSYLPPDQAQRTAEQLGSLSEGTAAAVDSEAEAVRGDGTSMWLQWSATAVRNANDEVDYFIAMFNDTTARHEAEVAAVANINVLERLNRLKSEFLTMVRHEFRTALVGISGFSELMRDSTELDLPTVQGFASDIYNDARRLDGMLDRMLDLDQPQTDKVGIHVEGIDLAAAVGDAVALARGSTTNHAITVDLEPGVPKVAGDAARLADLLRILLDNAIKYSPGGGGIVVSCRVKPGQVIVSVKDHGIGIPAGLDDQLFTSYQWIANNPTAKVMGTGFGLPMARQIVEMHGGRIWFESEAGVGSEFHFSLPAQTKKTAQAEAATPEAA